MADWKMGDPATYKVKIPNRDQDTIVRLRSVYDQRGKEPTMLVLEDQSDKQEESLFIDAVRTHVIKTLAEARRSQGLQSDPRQDDWYLLDQEGKHGDIGKLYSVSVECERVTRPDPLVAELERRNDEPLQDIVRLKKERPPLRVLEVTRTTLSDIDHVQQQALTKAFHAAVKLPDIGPDR